MKEVKRYDSFCYDGLSAIMVEDQFGDYVRLYDYYELLTERNELLVVAERLLEQPLTGNPSLDRLVEFWEYEKSLGNGYAAVQLAAISVIAKCRGDL